MLKRIAYAAGFLLLAQIHNAAVAQEASSAADQDLSYLFVVNEQAPMEKCYGLPDGKPKECAMDEDSSDCKDAEKRTAAAPRSGGPTIRRSTGPLR
jgi:hypothetical protein